MTPDQITAWAAGGESETLEFKRSTSQRREATRALCAMPNHRGGRVLVGVEPDGRVVGQQVGDHTLEEVAQELREINPPVSPSIEQPGGTGRLQEGRAMAHQAVTLPGSRLSCVFLAPFLRLSGAFAVWGR